VRVLVDEALFANPGLQGPLLALILACGFSWEEHHRIIVATDEQGLYDQWLASLQENVREEVSSLVSAWELEETQPALGAGQWTVRIVADGLSAWNKPEMTLNIFEASALLSRPFEIHVEDDQSDRAFLLSIAKPQWRERLEELEEAGRLVFFHGGGLPNMLRRVKRLKNKKRSHRWRIWTMFDSDGLRPGGRSTVARNLKSLAGRVVAGRWMLKRRFVESYIPQKALEAWASADESRRQIFDAWKGLDTEHKYHFNMKNGLGKDVGRGDFAAARRFWVDHVDDPALQKGFGRKVSEVLENPELCWSNYDADARDEANEALGQLLRML
jgi:hypothetical protein